MFFVRKIDSHERFRRVPRLLSFVMSFVFLKREGRENHGLKLKKINILYMYLNACNNAYINQNYNQEYHDE